MFLRPPDGPGPPLSAFAVQPPPRRRGADRGHSLAWRAVDALTDDRDLTRTQVVGNLVAATQGLTIVDEAFAVTPRRRRPGDLTTPGTVVRTGPRPTRAGSTPRRTRARRAAPLARVTVAGCRRRQRRGLPFTRPPTGNSVAATGGASEPVLWSWSPLVDAGEFDNAYTLDAARFAAVARNSDQSTQYDYAGDGGDTIRFGGNNFGVDAG